VVSCADACAVAAVNKAKTSSEDLMSFLLLIVVAKFSRADTPQGPKIAFILQSFQLDAKS
jgi:hypothetical protein